MRLPSTAILFLLPLLIVSCTTETGPPRERGPYGTVAYLVPIESSEPGARIEVNGETVGVTPMTLKIFGDRDGTFHGFGSYEFFYPRFPSWSGACTDDQGFSHRSLHGAR